MSEPTQKPLSERMFLKIQQLYPFTPIEETQFKKDIDELKVLEAEVKTYKNQWDILLPADYDPCCSECNHSRGCGILKSQKALESRLGEAQKFADDLCELGIMGESDGFTEPRKWINPQIGLALKKVLCGGGCGDAEGEKDKIKPVPLIDESHCPRCFGSGKIRVIFRDFGPDENIETPFDYGTCPNCNGTGKRVGAEKEYEKK